jgi:cytochrome P450
LTLKTLKSAIAIAAHDSEELPKLSALEQIPYLTATIYEGLRLSHGITHRLARSSPDEEITLRSKEGQTYIVPRNQFVSMSAPLIHHNEDIFPDSYSFKPERWLDTNGKKNKDLDKFLLTFSKGSRQCLGINLAFAELYICLTAIVTRLLDHVELYETDKSDVMYDHGNFTTRPKFESKGVRILVK